MRVVAGSDHSRDADRDGVSGGNHVNGPIVLEHLNHSGLDRPNPFVCNVFRFENRHMKRQFALDSTLQPILEEAGVLVK